MCFRLLHIFFVCKLKPIEGRFFFLDFLTKHCAQKWCVDQQRPFFDEHGAFERLQAMAFKSSKWSNDRWPGNYYPSSEAPEEIAPPSKQFSLLNRFSPTSRRSIKGQNLDDFHNWSLERKSQAVRRESAAQKILNGWAKAHKNHKLKSFNSRFFHVKCEFFDFFMAHSDFKSLKVESDSHQNKHSLVL